ncbi:MAG: hypothetical protein KKA05_07210 [Alphaproteobacteria bacterium]|nr:hypothetical protein [Alphaproteobacteria bacterium]
MIQPPIDTPEEVAEKEPLDKDLIDRAVLLLRGVARGNGLMSGQIIAGEVSGEVLNFEGLAYFKIEPKTSEKRVPGKEKGQVIGSASEMRSKIQNAVEKAASNPDVRKHTIQVLKKRPDLGAFMSNQYVTLEKLRQLFVVHEGCAPCGRDGKTMCQMCAGKGSTKCKKCFGTKDMPCTLCRGTKVIGTAQGQKTCTRCHGHGRITCTVCRHTGIIPCPTCKRTGNMPCQNCNGTGWHSLVGTLEVKAKSRFDYDRAALPPDITPRIDELGPKIITEKHMQAAIIEDEERFKQLAAISKADEYIIPYHLRLPVGKVTFVLPKKQELQADLFGFLPVLENLPAFLEAPLAKAFAALEAGKLREAMRARFVSESVMTALRHPRKKALRMMHKRYPYGIGAERLQKTIIAANGILKKIVTGPRWMGLAVGSVVAAALYAGYFIAPSRQMLRGVVDAQGAPDIVMKIADGGMFLIGALIAATVAQQMVRQGMRKALGKLAEKIPSRQLAPPAVMPFIVGLVISALLFVGTVEGAHIMKKDPPAWYEEIRQQIIPAPAKETAAQGTE